MEARQAPHVLPDIEATRYDIPIFAQSIQLCLQYEFKTGESICINIQYLNID